MLLNYNWPTQYNFAFDFLITFTKLRKATISFFLPVCQPVFLPVCPHGTTRLPLDRFSLKLIFEYFSKICRKKIQVSLKADNNNRYFTCAIPIFIHLAVCLTTGPKPLPKPALHTVRSRASSFKWQYPLLSLRSSSSFLRLLPRLPVTSIPPFIFPSTTRCRRQFLRKMWPIQLAFRNKCSLFGS